MQKHLSTILWFSMFFGLLLVTGLRPCASEGQARQTAPTSQPAASEAPAEKLDLSEQVIRDVFAPLQRGLEAHNLYQVLAVFDGHDMPEYAQFRDNLRAFFGEHDTIRLRYQLLQAMSDKNHAFAVAQIEMDAAPADPSQVTFRRETQMRLQMKLTAKGWRLVGFTPADFFTP